MDHGPLVLDDQIRCGLRLVSEEPDAARKRARSIEAVGFDSLWATDHLAFHVPAPEPTALLSFAAAVTERVTLGTAVLLLALRNPVWVAKQVATLDRLCGGRLVLGVGLGGEYPPEFAAAGVALRDRASRVDEGLGLLRRLWSGGPVEHQGRHHRFGPISVEPGPLQPDGPPIWIGGRSPAAMKRAGRLGDGYVSHMTTPDHYASNLELIAQAASDAGRSRAPFATAAFLFTQVEDSIEAAAQIARHELGILYAQDFGKQARKYCLLGPPETCVEQLRAYVEVGVRHFVLAPLADEERVAATLAAEVLPRLSGLLS